MRVSLAGSRRRHHHRLNQTLQQQGLYIVITPISSSQSTNTVIDTTTSTHSSPVASASSLMQILIAIITHDIVNEREENRHYQRLWCLAQAVSTTEVTLMATTDSRDQDQLGIHQPLQPRYILRKTCSNNNQSTLGTLVRARTSI